MNWTYKKKMVMSSMSSILSRTIYVSQLFFVYPILLKNLGDVEFGVLMALLGFGVVLNIFDFGVGNAIVRLVSQANESQDRTKIASNILSGIFLVLLFSGIICAFLIVAVNNFDISGLFSDLDETEMQPFKQVFVFFILFFGINLLNNFSLKVFQALQLGFIYYFANIFIQLCALLYIFFYKDEVTIITALKLFYGGPAVAGVLVMLVLPYVAQFKFSLAYVNLKCSIRDILSGSKLFLFLQFAYVLGWGFDTVFVSALLGSDAVGELSMLQRYFQLLTVPIAICVGPLWAAYAKFHISGNFDAIRKYLRFSMIFVLLVSCVISVVLALLYPTFLKLFDTNMDYVVTSVIKLAAFMAVIEAVGNAFAMYLNGMHIVRPQIIVTSMYMVVVLPVKYLLTLKYGLEGLYFASIAVYLACVAVPYVTFLKKKLTIQSQVNSQI